MRVAISLLTMNCLDWTKECIRSLHKYTPSILYDLFIVDNGSSDGTFEYLKDIKAEKVFLGKNVGVSTARNLIWHMQHEAGYYDFSCIIHNDMLFTPNWLEDLLVSYNKLDTKCILGCANILGDYWLSYNDLDRETVSSCCKCSGIAQGNFEPRIYPKSVWEDVGFFDERFQGSECEDVDYNRRLAAAGYKILCDNSINVFHVIGYSRLKIPGAQTIMAHNRKLFFEKWPGKDLKEYNESRRISINVDGIPHLLAIA